MTDTMDITDKRVVWTEERLALVKDLWANGSTASQIAAELPGITRNMICGMVHRNKFKRADWYVKGVVNDVVREIKEGREAPVRAFNPQRARRIIEGGSKPLPEIICEPVEVKSLHLTIDQLEERHCRWPELDSSEQTYCGIPAKAGRPYCSHHCKVAFVPIQPKVRPIRHAELKQARGGIFGRSA